MKVILFGATGMIGSGVLHECLEDPSVEAVLIVVRAPTTYAHAKLRELVHKDFFDYSAIRDQFDGYDACFFCLGVSSAGMPEAEYHRLTYELTIAAAETLAARNPGMTFCYVSGQGADSTERGRFMWARVKGKTENQLLRMPLNAFMFRPGFVQPMKGVRSRTPLYQAFYTAFTPFFPLIRRLMPRGTTTSQNMGRAMIRVTRSGYPKRILENVDINAIADDSPAPS
jgi:uncharacterized protein YbjT (DUF2867 family)